MAARTDASRGPQSAVGQTTRAGRSRTGIVRSAALLGLVLCACQIPAIGGAPRPVMADELRAEPYARTAADSEAVEAVATCVALLEEGVATEAEAAVAPANVRWAGFETDVPRLQLRGDPSFDVTALPTEARCWYDELWRVVTNADRNAVTTRLASSDDIYTYGRTIQTHVLSLLTAFRLTGDLALLDEVDRLAQHMRSALADSWRGAAAFDRGGVDGYWNWVWRATGSRSHLGRDLHEVDEMRTHALVAEMAWAFAMNADLPSPNGVDYAERAHFWTEYLTQHFEAKWRERNGVAWPDFPFLRRQHMHETVTFTRYHLYMYRLTGKEPYLEEARRLAQLTLANTREVDTAVGPALVWPRSILSEGGQLDYLHPSTYARYVMADAIDLFFEGFGWWGEPATLEMLAATVTQFLFDNGSQDFARDIGGGVARAGIRPSPTTWARLTRDKYLTSPYALLAPWDVTGAVAKVSVQVYDAFSEDERDVFIPVGMMTWYMALARGAE